MFWSGVHVMYTDLPSSQGNKFNYSNIPNKHYYNYVIINLLFRMKVINKAIGNYHIYIKKYSQL